jgi:hypothetical protein
MAGSRNQAKNTYIHFTYTKDLFQPNYEVYFVPIKKCFGSYSNVNENCSSGPGWVILLFTLVGAKNIEKRKK